ncbi:MAG: hypothetical protein ACOX8R_00540 [Bacillota bacterium]|jgi:DNA-binding XRE family transcriptional regulator
MFCKEKFLARMVLAGYNRTRLSSELNVSKNSLCDKINGKSKWDIDLAEDACALLGITDGLEKAEIFFAESSQ